MAGGKPPDAWVELAGRQSLDRLPCGPDLQDVGRVLCPGAEGGTDDPGWQVVAGILRIHEPSVVLEAPGVGRARRAPAWRRQPAWAPLAAVAARPAAGRGRVPWPVPSAARSPVRGCRRQGDVARSSDRAGRRRPHRKHGCRGRAGPAEGCVRARPRCGGESRRTSRPLTGTASRR